MLSLRGSQIAGRLGLGVGRCKAPRAMGTALRLGSWRSSHWPNHHLQLDLGRQPRRVVCSPAHTSQLSTTTHHFSSRSVAPAPSSTRLNPPASLSSLNSRQSLPTLASSTQCRSHGGSSHHHHHHDNTYLTSTNKNDAGVRITRIGLFVNLAMAIGKGIGGYVFHSQALIADAIHSLTDLLSDFMTLATVSLSVKPPSATFPSGYGKIESLGSVGVSGMLLVGGLLMGWNACEVLYSQLFLDAAAAAEHLSHGHGHGHGHGHSHSHMDLGPNINAIWIVGGSIVVKEYLYRATMKIALERKSSVLASNAVHHRVDSLSSIVALVAIAGANFFSNAAWLDPVGGLLVSLMVIRAGWSNTGAALLELADVAVDSDIRDSVRRAAEGCLVPERLTILLGEASVGQVAVRDVQGVKSGQNYLMELQLAVPGSCSVSHLQTLETLVREAVAASVRGVRRVKIRFVASETASTDFKAEFIGIDEPADLASTEKKHE